MNVADPRSIAEAIAVELRAVDCDRVPEGAAFAALARVAPWRCIDLVANAEPGAALSRAMKAEIVSAALVSACDHPEAFGFDAASALRALDACGDHLSAAALGRLSHVKPPFAPVEAAIERAVDRGSSDPVVLRAAMRGAQQRGDVRRFERAAAVLARVDATPATLASIARVRKTFAPAENARPVKVALVSSYTVDHLAPFVEQVCSELGLAATLYVAPFNSWMREAIDPNAGLRAFAPDITFLSVAIDDLIPGLAGTMARDAREAAGEEALARIVETARAYAGWAGGAPLVVHSLHSVFAADPAGLAGGEREPSRREWLRERNLRLAAELRLLGARLLDVEDAVAVAGGSLADAPKLRHIASMHMPPAALSAIAQSYARYIAPLKGLTRKCVIVDLDNTLWGGVVGEDGKDGLRLGTTSPGSEFVEFQHFLKGLRERGILLALCSKNNEADALEAIRTHPAMVLAEGDFSALRINWQPKPENVLSIAAELNIGVDSFVFVDDNPDERELMRAMLPEVLTVDMPRDPALYRSTLERLPQLQVLTVTAEDRERPALYATSRLREAARVTASSLDEYLHSLDVTVAIRPAQREGFARIVQLFARTNQFNTTTRRYDLPDVQRFATDERYGLYTLESRDRFGSHGVVAVGLIEHRGDESRIESFLMSCRVIGYGIEAALLSQLAADARAKGATMLRGAFVPTKKNAPAAQLFEQHGFVRVSGDPTLWEIALDADSLPMPAWIAREA